MKPATLRKKLSQGKWEDEGDKNEGDGVEIWPWDFTCTWKLLSLQKDFTRQTAYCLESLTLQESLILGKHLATVEGNNYIIAAKTQRSIGLMGLSIGKKSRNQSQWQQWPSSISDSIYWQIQSFVTDFLCSQFVCLLSVRQSCALFLGYSIKNITGQIDDKVELLLFLHFLRFTK